MKDILIYLACIAGMLLTIHLMFRAYHIEEEQRMEELREWTR